MRLSVDEFLGRLLQHVPPPGMKVVRSYGLYAPRNREALKRAHAVVEPNPEWREARRRLDRRHSEAGTPKGPRCPVCGRALVVAGLASRVPASGRPPPQLPAALAEAVPA